MPSPAAFRAVVIEPTLWLMQTECGFPDAVASDDAATLMLRTAMMESRLEHTVQLGGGPARGFFQVEPKWATAVLKKHPKGRLVGDVFTCGYYFHPDEPLDHHHLELNPFFCCAVARLIYWQATPKAVPPAANVDDQFLFWLFYFNGKGVLRHRTQEQALADWRLCAERCAA